MEAHAYRRIHAKARYVKGKDLDKGKDGHSNATVVDRGDLENKIESPSTPLTRYTTTSGIDDTIEIGYP